MEKIKSLLFVCNSKLNPLERKTIEETKPIHNFNIFGKGNSFESAEINAFNQLKDLAEKDIAYFAVISSQHIDCSYYPNDKFYYYGLVGSLYNKDPTIKPSQNL